MPSNVCGEYSVDDGTLVDLVGLGASIYLDGADVTSNNIISVNPTDGWIKCGTGIFNVEKREWIDYYIYGVITWELPSNAK